ncbi:hypothetical protein C0J52_19398 [Blattella germanica]|nr:hypothetical protein C0J52_19398 [Blattella germanica]
MASSFQCECGKIFTRRSNLKRHVSNFHSESEYQVPDETLPYKCVICQCDCADLGAYSEHVREAHDIEIKTEFHEFETESDFYNWKQMVEDNDNASYVKQRKGNVLTDGSLSVKFHCHRSGKYRTRVLPDNRKRELRKGSSKIGGYCPAKIKAIFQADGEVDVTYCPTHIGHKNELMHLRLPEDQRKEIAMKIAMKVPYDDILNQVRSSVPMDEIKRRHIVTKQDLYNIERDFSLKNEAVRRPIDVLAIDPAEQLEKFKADLREQFENILLKINSKAQCKICHESLESLDCLLDSSDQQPSNETVALPKKTKRNVNIERKKRVESNVKKCST